MIKKQSIQEIIEGCCKKQPKFQRIFVERYADFLYAICIRYMGNREIAKDALQQSLFKIFEHIKTFDASKGKLESWISKIAINTCLSTLRIKSLDIIPFSETIQDEQSIQPEIIDQLDTEAILQIVQDLPDIYREIFNLIEIDGYNHQEVAEMLGIQVGSCRARLSRSKELLRAKLGELKKNESWVNVV